MFSGPLGKLEEEEYSSQILRQEMEQLQNNVELKEKLVQLAGQPKMLPSRLQCYRDTYDAGENLA